MPHKDALCHYCDKPMGIGRVHPTMTPYHGACRLEAIRKEWRDASEERRAVLETEAETIKHHEKSKETA